MQAVAARTGVFAPGSEGSSHPIGATLTPDGLNVSVYAKRATGVDLLLFDDVEDDTPARVIDVGHAGGRTGPYWHAFVPGIVAGQAYAFRARGPSAPERGLRFDPDAVLLDPYGRGVAVPDGYRREAAGPSMKSVVVDVASYDWEGDRPLGRPFGETVIYEAHVKGFTAHPSSGVDATRRGTYAGFIERIPYLVDLGITAVELLPVFAFDAQAAPGRSAELLGLSAGLVLRAARGVREPARRAGGARRVPRPRQGPPSGRHRGHPRRRLQPHGRGRRRRPDVLLSRPRQRAVLPARPR